MNSVLFVTNRHICLENDSKELEKLQRCYIDQDGFWVGKISKHYRQEPLPANSRKLFWKVMKYGSYRDTMVLMIVIKFDDNDDEQNGGSGDDDWLNGNWKLRSRKCQQEQSDLSLESTWRNLKVMLRGGLKRANKANRFSYVKRETGFYGFFLLSDEKDFSAFRWERERGFCGHQGDSSTCSKWLVRWRWVVNLCIRCIWLKQGRLWTWVCSSAWELWHKVALWQLICIEFYKLHELYCVVWVAWSAWVVMNCVSCF